MKKISDANGDLYKLDYGGYIHFMKITHEKKYEGTTNEELIEVLLHRIEGLNNKMPCLENMNAIGHLAMAKEWLERRFKKRQDLDIVGNLEVNHQ